MDFAQPRGMAVDLFDYQLLAASSLERREELQKITTGVLEVTTSVGIFADRPGYGKTLCMLAVILRDRLRWNLEEPHTKLLPDFSDRYNLINATRRCELEEARSNASLVVAHANLQDHWEAELAKTGLTYLRIRRGRDYAELNPDLYEVILCPHDAYQTFVRVVDFVWKRVVFDEPESAPIPAMAQIEAGFLWLITSSPALIFDRFRATRCSNHFLKSLFRRIPRDVFDRLVVKSDDRFVAESCESALRAAGRRPVLPPARLVYKCRPPPILAVLGDAVPQNVQAMLGADAVDDAVATLRTGAAPAALPAISPANIVDLVLAQLKTQSPSEKTEALIAEVSARFDQMRFGRCSICWASPMADPVFVQCCQNMFGGACLLRWLETNPTCPLCRDAQVQTKLVRVAAEPAGETKTPAEEREGGPSAAADAALPKTKGETLLSIIRENPQGSFILYSAYNDSFKRNRAMLRGAAISYVELRGGDDRAAIAKYRAGEAQVLMLSARHPGAGIGFENTSDIILYHPVEPEIEQQLVGRANRVGRTLPDPLRVHCLEF